MEPALASASRIAAERYGDATFCTWGDGFVLSFQELDDLSDQVAAWMQGRGIGPGDVILLSMPSIAEYVVSYIASQKVGAIAAGVNPRLTAPERDALAGLVAPRLVLATPELVPNVGEESEIVQIEPAGRANSMLASLRAPHSELVAVSAEPGAPAVIVFTSGTTGLPKGAVFSNRGLTAIAAADAGGHHSGASTPVGTSLALLGFMTKLKSYLEQGCMLLLIGEWHAADALRLAAENHLSTIGGIPTQVALMLRLDDFETYDLSSVKRIVLGGAPAAPALVRQARERFGVPVLIRYSCTESGIGMGTAEDDPPEDAEVSVGRPRKGVELTIRDEQQRPLPRGSTGEVCLRTDASMLGYYNNEEATRAVFTDDGAVRTGDLGWVDDEGRLRLVGRSKDMYIRGGYNVFPVEIERVLIEHPGVAEVAVVPRSDDVMGEIGVAVVVPTDPANPPSLDDLRVFAGAHLAKHKLPEDIMIMEELDRTGGEKIDRRSLRRRVEAGPPSARAGTGPKREPSDRRGA